MNNFTKFKSGLKPARFILLFVLMLSFTVSCKKMNIDKNDLRNFQQVNLVSSDGAGSPVLTEPTMLNAWGLAWAPSGIAWVNAEAGHVSELFSGEGAELRPGINIPSPTDATG